jgi:hypothetical protein
MFRYLQLFWYYPSFFICLYIYTITLQKKSKLIVIDQIMANLIQRTKILLERLNLQ